MITELWGQSAFYDMMLDITVTCLTPGLWLEMHPNYNSVPVGKYDLHHEDTLYSAFPRGGLG